MKLVSILLFILLLIIFVFVFIGGIFYLMSKASIVLQSAGIGDSPLEDGVLIEDKETCIDSDGGVFFKEKGVVSYERDFLFFKWRSGISDTCNKGVLQEYYCGDDGLKGNTVECDSGCIDGACVERIFID